jgi:glycosyltransferase involved in cell wall biosynthesis
VSQKPDIALLISTYQRPAHLRRALLSVGLQRDVAHRMEVVVSDDGSTDETAQVVEAFARTAKFRVHFTTHPHTTFQLARCRNEGVAASSAPYLLFLDGDCILPPDHVAIHLAQRRPTTVMAGDFAKLDQATSARVTDEVIQAGAFIGWAPKSEIARLSKQDRRARLYQLLRHPTKPKIVGNNVGIWRSDYERVNGYDENFEGWGCEDDDLRLRLRRAGVRIQSILRYTHTYHLWHPTDPSYPQSWRNGRNVEYLNRKGRLVQCINGLVKRPLEDLRLAVVGAPPPASIARPLAVLQSANPNGDKQPPEFEIVFVPSPGCFSGQAECNVLVVMDEAPIDRRLMRRADIIVSDKQISPPDGKRQYRLQELEDALKRVA